MTGKVRAIGVAFTTSEVTIKNMFERCGDVGDVLLLKDPSNQSKGVAIITYENPNDAKRAVKEMNGVNIDGMPLRVTAYSSSGNSDDDDDESSSSSPEKDDDRDSDHYSSRREDRGRQYDSPRDSRRGDYRDSRRDSYSRDRDSYYSRRDSNSRDRDSYRDRNPPRDSRRDSYRERDHGRDMLRDFPYDEGQDEIDQIYNDLVKLLEQYKQNYSSYE